MTSPFILERAKVLAQIEYDKRYAPITKEPPPFDVWFAYERAYYIAMAQAITDHDTKEGRKVVDDSPTDEMMDAGWEMLPVTPGGANVRAAGGVWAAMFDAAPNYPGESK